MLGTRVLTVDGRELGTVTDVEFDTDSGAVVRVQTDQGPIEPDRLRSLGSYALVVDSRHAVDRAVTGSMLFDGWATSAGSWGWAPRRTW